MARRRAPLQLLLSAAVPAAALLIVAGFATFAIVGENGLLKRSEYRDALEKQRAELASVKEERARLENRKRLLQQGDIDLADELTRAATATVGENEYVVMVR